jgi:hypothetical protein
MFVVFGHNSREDMEVAASLIALATAGIVGSGLPLMPIETKRNICHH